jgi:hypothetical protein
VPGVVDLSICDDEGNGVDLDEADAIALVAFTDGFEEATVSACPSCRSRVLAAVAFVEVLEAAAPHPATEQLMELADDAPTLHLYVIDHSTDCTHPAWRDPGAEEWADVTTEPGPRAHH